MSAPSNVIVPVIFTWSIRSFSRLKQRSSVDLPQPEGPIRAVTRFFGIRIDTDWSACFSWYQRSRFSVEMIGGSVILCPHFFLEMCPCSDRDCVEPDNQHQQDKCRAVLVC